MTFRKALLGVALCALAPAADAAARTSAHKANPNKALRNVMKWRSTGGYLCRPGHDRRPSPPIPPNLRAQTKPSCHVSARPHPPSQYRPSPVVGRAVHIGPPFVAKG